ncbi:MAG: hypothetical protein FJ276_24050, partial [Planctomycetes bacterium]|nr:hypothetical protein [Planctomycetota bacterium]
MLERDLQWRLAQVGDRFRVFRRSIGLAAIWLGSAALAALMLWTNVRFGWFAPAGPYFWLAAVVLAGGVCVGVVGRTARDPLWLARRIEAYDPHLKERLLAAVEQRVEPPARHFGFLQEAVIQEALLSNRQRPWTDTVPGARLAMARVANGVSLLLLVAAGAALFLHYSSRGRMPGGDAGTVSLQLAAGGTAVTIEPGDTEVERGTSLLVLARFSGRLPADTTLVYQETGGAAVRREMSRSLDDPIFVARVAPVLRDLTYHVEYGGDQSRTYRVSVYEHPTLVRMDARLRFPDYTSHEETLLQDTRRISAVQGTDVTLLCHLNKRVASARLAGDDDSTLSLVEDDGEGNIYRVQLTLDASRRYTLHLRDEHGRANKTPPEIVVNVIPNRPPTLEIAWPARDLEVSPLEELTLKARVSDDFGLTRYGLSYTLAGQSPEDVLLVGSTQGNNQQTIEYVLAMEALRARVDQLVSYHFWAEDIGPDGQTRRAFSDMYFAEVRPFDEIFRQGQQPAGGSQEQQQQQQQQDGNLPEPTRLAELQKQIINATWNIVRRETGERPSEPFVSDTGVVAESQRDALKQTEALAERLQDGQSRKLIDAVAGHMNDAIQQLSLAAERREVATLIDAIASEQQAYQTLLQLRGREHEVVRGQQRRQQQQSQSAGQQQARRSQQQLQQLQLDDSENRYEEQRAAGTRDEDQSARETRQVLNRLRELARRQSDLNQQLKELQSALETAETEEEREEIRRRLKRLQEEQERVLRDTDELQERLDREENRQRMAESREQLQQTRENVRRASEALENGRVAQALTSGTRAERELTEMRDELRKEAAGRFQEEMQTMRDDAQELDNRQQEISRELTGANQPATEPNGRQQRSLRDAPQREGVLDSLRQQRESLTDLLDRMQEVIQEAESPEPL